jgi:hypothetical protein
MREREKKYIVQDRIPFKTTETTETTGQEESDREERRESEELSHKRRPVKSIVASDAQKTVSFHQSPARNRLLVPLSRLAASGYITVSTVPPVEYPIQLAILYSRLSSLKAVVIVNRHAQGSCSHSPRCILLQYFLFHSLQIGILRIHRDP